MQDVNNREIFVEVGVREYIQTINTILSAQPFCESKSALKNKIY